MKAIVCIPALDGSIKAKCHTSLTTLYHVLRGAGIAYDEFIIENCPCLPVARNTLAAMFMADPEATDLFFIDSDEKFDAAGALKILQRPEDIVAGIYPLKRDALGWPVKIKTRDGIPLGRDGLIEAEFLPTGFMRIKRRVFEKLIEAHPHLKYADSVIDVLGANVPEAWDFFHMGIDPERQRWTTEDYAFCQRWTDLGGQLWVYADIDFEHIGSKAYCGNYHQYLLGLPGGAKSSVAKADQTPGWMTIHELSWLAMQAERRSQIVEVGSWMGRSTRALADNTRGEVYAVDTWEGSKEHSEIMKTLTPESLFASFKANVADCPNVVAVRKPSTVAAVDFSERRFDMVFLDGSHDYESVKADIASWRPLLSRGGIMCGHDFSWPEVKKAVTELLPTVLPVPNTDIWVWAEMGLRD